MDKYKSSKGKHRCCGLCRAMARPGGGGERVARASRVTSNNIIFGRYGFRDAKSAGPGGANVVVRVDTKLPPEALRHAAESAHRRSLRGPPLEAHRRPRRSWELPLGRAQGVGPGRLRQPDPPLPPAAARALWPREREDLALSPPPPPPTPSHPSPTPKSPSSSPHPPHLDPRVGPLFCSAGCPLISTSGVCLHRRAARPAAGEGSTGIANSSISQLYLRHPAKPLAARRPKVPPATSYTFALFSIKKNIHFFSFLILCSQTD
jgi:hypothetical protein